MIESLPLHDWQFWVATVLAVLALWLTLRPLLPARNKKNAACPGCPSGSAAQKPPREKPVDLTIGGKRMKRS